MFYSFVKRWSFLCKCYPMNYELQKCLLNNFSEASAMSRHAQKGMS